MKAFHRGQTVSLLEFIWRLSPTRGFKSSAVTRLAVKPPPDPSNIERFQSSIGTPYVGPSSPYNGSIGSGQKLASSKAHPGFGSHPSSGASPSPRSRASSSAQSQSTSKNPFSSLDPEKGRNFYAQYFPVAAKLVGAGTLSFVGLQGLFSYMDKSQSAKEEARRVEKSKILGKSGGQFGALSASGSESPTLGTQDFAESVKDGAKSVGSILHDAKSDLSDKGKDTLGSATDAMSSKLGEAQAGVKDKGRDALAKTGLPTTQGGKAETNHGGSSDAKSQTKGMADVANSSAKEIKTGISKSQQAGKQGLADAQANLAEKAKDALQATSPGQATTSSLGSNDTQGTEGGDTKTAGRIGSLLGKLSPAALLAKVPGLSPKSSDGQTSPSLPSAERTESGGKIDSLGKRVDDARGKAGGSLNESIPFAGAGPPESTGGVGKEIKGGVKNLQSAARDASGKVKDASRQASKSASDSIASANMDLSGVGAGKIDSGDANTASDACDAGSSPSRLSEVVHKFTPSFIASGASASSQFLSDKTASLRSGVGKLTGMSKSSASAPDGPDADSLAGPGTAHPKLTKLKDLVESTSKATSSKCNDGMKWVSEHSPISVPALIPTEEENAERLQFAFDSQK